MRELQRGPETDIVAGGATPQLVCAPTTGTAENSVKICQTSSNLTIITRREISEAGGSGGIWGKFKEVFDGGITGEGSNRETKTSVTICKPDGSCTNLPPTIEKGKSSDAADGSTFENYAEVDYSGGDLYAGADYSDSASGGFDGGGGFGDGGDLGCGGFEGDFFEIETA